MEEDKKEQTESNSECSNKPSVIQIISTIVTFIALTVSIIALIT